MGNLQSGLAERVASFIGAARVELGLGDIDAAPAVSDMPAIELERVLIADPSQPTQSECEAMAKGFHSRTAVVAFECEKPVCDGDHPLVQLGLSLSSHIPTRWPIGLSAKRRHLVTEIRDIHVEDQASRSLTNKAMAAHQDGWLSLDKGDRGALAVTSLWADSVPQQSASTFAQNVVFLALDLRRRDEAAFAALFADDAVRIVRAGGETAMLSPVLFLNRGMINSFYRGANDEYDVVPGSPDPALARAIEFLNLHMDFGANGSVSTRLDRVGRGLFMNNRYCVHGRTKFEDGGAPDRQRIIASKWWASEDRHRDLSWE